ncbi:hypothetical protein SAMN04490356_0358 [Streptomyces melanosporofaciens]|uniref:Uncharacterized protein n=1 Tax=Streptomyces melanosporofaciens TaxID=67327 RepID=A0A1H4ICL8_STRMJ|nr:hypothetical protein SAMN04490356_0358 [Streptomyces melanosporofaciens]
MAGRLWMARYVNTPSPSMEAHEIRDEDALWLSSLKGRPMTVFSGTELCAIFALHG